MNELINLLGCSVESQLARDVLESFGTFVTEVLDFAPDEGMPKDFYLSCIPAGISIKHEESGQITTIFLMREGRDGYAQFPGKLGNNLSFSSSPTEVRAVLGEPSFERQASQNTGYLSHGSIMRYDKADYSIHFQFLLGGTGIELITLMSPTSVPRRL